MPRRNHPPEHVIPQTPKGAQKGPAPTELGRKARPELVPMVPTTGTCPTGKLRYATTYQAEEALACARENRRRLGSAVVEERYYPQPGDKPCPCGGFHLTSKPRRKPEARRNA